MTARDVREHAERIRAAQLAKARNRLSPDARRAAEVVTAAVVRTLLDDPAVRGSLERSI